MITILITEQSGGRYNATLDGRLLCRRSRQPLFDAARELLRCGASADAEICMVRPGGAQPALRAILGVAASLTVSEHGRCTFIPYRAMPSIGRAA